MSSGEADAYYNRNKWLIDGSGPKVAPKQEETKDYWYTRFQKLGSLCNRDIRNQYEELMRDEFSQKSP